MRKSLCPSPGTFSLSQGPLLPWARLDYALESFQNMGCKDHICLNKVSPLDDSSFPELNFLFWLEYFERNGVRKEKGSCLYFFHRVSEFLIVQRAQAFLSPLLCPQGALCQVMEGSYVSVLCFQGTMGRWYNHTSEYTPRSQWLRIEVPEDTAKKTLLHATYPSASALSFSDTVYRTCPPQENAHYLPFHTAQSRKQTS